MTSALDPTSSELPLTRRVRWCLLAVLMMTGLQTASVLDPMERLTHDLRARWWASDHPRADNIVILAIDGPSLQRMASRFGAWPWPHGAYIGLLDFCSEAAVIGMDIVHTHPDPRMPPGENLFAEAVRQHGRVVIGALFDHQVRRPAWPEGLEHISWRPTGEAAAGLRQFASVEAPFAALAEAAAGIGHVNCEADSDGVLRRYLVGLECQGRVVPSLALEIVRLYQGLNAGDVEVAPGDLRLGTRRMPLGPDGGLLLRFAAREAFTPQAYPIADVLDAYRDELRGNAPQIPREAFRDKLVLIGSTTSGLYHDLEATPTSRTTPGVVVHANALDNLLSGEAYRRLPAGWEWLLASLLTLLPAWLPTSRPLSILAALAVVGGAYLATVAIALGLAGWMAPVASPLLGLTLAGGLLGGRRWYAEIFRRHRLEQLEQAKQRFTDMLVHDLKGHTSAIQMTLALIKRRIASDHDAPTRQLLQIAETGSQRLQGQVQSLLDIRRMQEGRMPLHRKDVDLPDVLESIRIDFAAAAEMVGGRLVRDEANGGSLRVSVDPDIFTRVLGNLVWNAIQYAAQGSDIRLGARRVDAEWVECSVANQGRTIPPEQQQAVFEAYVSGALADKELKVPSTGLGLAFCKIAVEAHGGRIHIESPWRDGGGVKVIVELPSANNKIK